MATVLNLNNEVVKMRKDVKKVKVLTIRKLTRNISKLKSKKGTEELIQKNQRRAQRLLEEIHTIKKLRPDDVTKIGLQKEINYEKECKKPNSTVETRAIARLATHPMLKQKISTIKAAIKAFKEARKIAAEQEATAEETCKPDEPTEIERTDTEKQCKQKKTKQNHAEEDTDTEDNPPCKTLNKETDFIDCNQRHEENIVDSQDGPKPALLTIPNVSPNGKGVPEIPASLTVHKVSVPIEVVLEKPVSFSVSKVSTEDKLIEGVPKKPASPTIPKVSVEDKLVGTSKITASVTVPKVLAKRKPVEVVPKTPASLTVSKVSTKQKPVETVPKNAPSLTDPKVSAERKPVTGVPETQALKIKIGKKSQLGKKTPVCELGSDTSDIEDSDKEDKEYFDDSTEERFHRQSSGFEDSDSESEDDFFIGKVRQTKKKKSRKNPSEDKSEKGKLPTQTTQPSSGAAESQKGNLAPTSVKLESVFFSSLSNTKQRPSFMKRESKVPPARNKKAVVPQPPKLEKKPQAARNSAVMSQSKPAPALHPSWEASRKRKEQSQIAVFQGKKIVFDD